ncbi:MAG TPA: MFS transporter [Candidatus Limnocylindrales bacterium]|nr:MFS transporter [Candidatus Limnocylindrales bacterium]
MLIGGIVLGLVLGLVLGGKLERLADIRLRYLPLLFIAVIVRFGTEILLGAGVGILDTLRLPLFGLAYGLLLWTLWHNRAYPGLALAFVGIALNAIVILVNGGRMPVWMPAYEFAGLDGPLNSVLHIPLESTDPEFFRRLGPLSDVIPIPIPPFNNVASIGDVFLSAGLAFFLFATLLRSSAETQAAMDEAREGRLLGVSGTARLRATGATAPGTVPPSTGLSPALEDTAALERPLMLGSPSTGMAAPALTAFPEAASATAAGTGRAATIAVGARPPRRSTLARVRRHPYVRLALNGSFSALWFGQLISLFGDRVNQIALLYFVYQTTNSPLQVALTFVASNLPNLLFSPVAGALVDRWDQKQVLVVSDILRAALVLLVPVAIYINVWLAYPLVFLITTVSLFFRPARISILPRIVAERDLLSANSAMWVGDTIADVVNYPLAGIFVLFLGSSVALAFWLDAVTYLASAALLATMVVPPIVRRARAKVNEWGEPVEGGEVEEAPAGPPSVREIRQDLKEGWAFLRGEATLLANTIQGTAAQLAVGVVTALGIVIAKEIDPVGATATYAFMETAIGVGNLLGGFVLGLVASRVSKGRLIIGAYTAFGILVMLVGLLPPFQVMLALMFAIGVANMAFVIPSQTLFQERTPPEMMARAVSFRFALVFGGMTVATTVLGLVANVSGIGPVIVFAGLIAVIAGLAGLLFPAVRDA